MLLCIGKHRHVKNQGVPSGTTRFFFPSLAYSETMTKTLISVFNKLICSFLDFVDRVQKDHFVSALSSLRLLSVDKHSVLSISQFSFVNVPEMQVLPRRRLIFNTLFVDPPQNHHQWLSPPPLTPIIAPSPIPLGEGILSEPLISPKVKSNLHFLFVLCQIFW